MADPRNGKDKKNDNNNGNKAEHVEHESPLVVDPSWIANLIC